MSTSKKQETFSKKVIKAAEVYALRKDREAHPDGTFDNANRFYPSDGEHQGCCNNIRSPSRSWPYSLMTHCRTAEHVAHLCNVDVKELRRVYKMVVVGRLERRQVLNAIRCQQPDDSTRNSDAQRVFWQPKGRGGEVRECLERNDAWLRATRYYLAPSKADAQVLAWAVSSGAEGLCSINRENQEVWLPDDTPVEYVYALKPFSELHRLYANWQRTQDALVANSPDYGPELTAVSL